MQKILVLNSGSSSIKVKIFNQKFVMILDALLERIGQDGNMKIAWNNQTHEVKSHFFDHAIALKTFLEFLKSKEIIKDLNQEIIAIGHRVVMGGDVYKNPTLVNEDVLKTLEEISHLAPLHNPANLLGIKQMQALVNKPNVIVCDTGFHQSLDAIKYLYPLPYCLFTDQKIRKYGMHGISYEYTVKQFIKKTKINKPSLIIFHLGNGCSVSAIKDGLSFNTSMGLTPLAGLMMGTRSGDIDPAIGTFLQRQLNIGYEEVDNIFNKDSGLKGISQISNDMREIIALKDKGDKYCTLAFTMFINRLVKFYCEYINDLDNKVDGIIFTGGIGYNSAAVINSFVEKIKISNLKLVKNWTNRYLGWEKISDHQSQFPLYISETNEELEIAQQTMTLLEKKHE